MPTMTLWLPLMLLVATATVTPVPETSPTKLELRTEPRMMMVPPHPAPGPPGDVGASVLPMPTRCAHPEELPISDAPLKAIEPPSLEELGTMSNGSVAAPSPEELGTMSNGSVAAPSPKELGTMSNGSVAAPSPKELGTMSNGSVAALSPEELGMMANGSVAAPSPEELGTMANRSVAAPSPEELGTMANRSVAAPSPEELGTMANRSVAAPSPEELGTIANGSTVAPTPNTTCGLLDTLGTTAPPCPGDDEPAEACGVPTEEQRVAVAEALGTFTLRFYQHMAEAAQPDANLLFSPINVAMGLSHILLGARGETRERLGAILAYPPELGCVHSALKQLASAPGLFSAAEIFHHPELHLRSRFLNESWLFYGARPRALSGNETLDLLHINEWVREASRGLLPGLLSALPPQPRLLLLSAVHLRATWRTPLKAKQTMLLPFLRPGAPPRLVPTMTSKKYPVGSFADNHLQVQVGRLELSGGLSLVVLVPLGPLGPLQTLEQALTPPTFLGLLRRASQTPLRATALALPRMRFDLALDVVALVHDMDYGLFLDAELCGMARGPAAVDAARHRAVLALDEAGVEAAGAMATSVARTALMLEALRPFLFVLWHDAGAVPFFMGRLSDPQP